MGSNGQVSMEAIRELRRRSGAGVLACRRALEEAGGDVNEAARVLVRREHEASARRAAQWTGEGYVASYVHHTGRLAALVEVGCETDFVARTEEFRTFAHRLAEHVAGAPASSNVAELLAQPWVRDPGTTVGQLVRDAAGRFGEAINVRRFVRLDLAEG